MPRLMLLRHLGASLFGVALLVLAAAPPAATQTTTGTIRGYVRDSSGAPFGGAMVEAKNVATGGVRTTTSREDGSYVLPGLVPGAYDLTVRHIGSAPSTQRVVVEIGATALINITPASQAVAVEGVTVQGVAPTFDTRTSENATNVTPQQIAQLPSVSRNFLDLAALAPGVVIPPDRIDPSSRNTSPKSPLAGAMGSGELNVYIDGASMKNDLTGGEGQYNGTAGEDASRGNPFPRNAVQEYRVITQNFKAEYGKASSAIITAVTKSGGNEWHGSVLTGFQDKGFVALDTFQLAQKHIADSIASANNTPSTFKEPDYSRYLIGLTAGGPLIKDKLHFFGSYEGNYQNRTGTVNINPPSGFPALAGYNLTSFNGNFTSPFRETLVFGKLSYDATDHSTVELSLSDRLEHDVRDYDGTQSYQSATNYNQNVAFGTLKYTYAPGAWLNEAMVTYERFRRNPTAAFPGIPQQNFGFAEIGSYESDQDFIQKRLGFRDDLTYTGWHWAGDHVVKGGLTVDFLNYDVNKGNNASPIFSYGDSVNCNPNCTGNVSYAYQSPYQLVWASGSPFVNAHNTEVGAYLQDDWSPTSRLTFNVGLRWDFESNMFNTDYVTPQAVIDTITKYNNQLQHPIDPATYFTDGTQRKPFYGAFQPRLGFSLALDDQNRTTLFGGVGRYYDRSYFDLSVDEQLKISRPTYTVHFAPSGGPVGPGQIAWNNSDLTTNPHVLDSLVQAGQAGLGEAWLFDNHAKVPYSNQFSLGIRRQIGNMLATVQYQGVRSYDQLILNWANFAWNNYGTDSSSCCAGGGPFHGYNNIIYSTSNGRTWYDAVSVQLNRPYRRTTPDGIAWGAGITYTYATRSVSGVDNPDDEFAFPQAIYIPKHPSNDEKSHVVANWITDVPYLFGFQFSGLITLGSGPRQDIAGRFDPSQWVPGGFTPARSGFIIPANWWAYREVDVRLAKAFPNISGTTLNVTLDVFNLFNYQNFGCFNTNPAPNPNLGQASCVISDPRRVQLGAEYTF